MCSFIWKHFSNPIVSPHEDRESKQRSSLVDPTIVTKLPFIYVKTETQTEGSFDDQLYQEYSYQQLLKSPNSSSSYSQ